MGSPEVFGALGLLQALGPWFYSQMSLSSTWLEGTFSTQPLMALRVPVSREYQKVTFSSQHPSPQRTQATQSLGW